jgi:GntR family transcriptional regulator
VSRIAPPAETAHPPATSAAATPDVASGSGGTRRVRRDAPIPYYAQLARILEQEIADGVWAPGDDLPSEAELCSLHGLSRTAVRQALAALATRGLVRKEKGRRSSVLRSRVTNLVVQELRGFYDEMTERGGSVETTILRQELVQAPPHLAEELEIPAGGDVVLISRLRAVDGERIVYVETSLPAPRFAPLLGMDLSSASLYAVLAEKFGVRPSSGRRVIEAVSADARLAGRLRVREHSPVLQLTAVDRDEDGIPFESFQAWYRGDETRFELIVGT